MNSSFDTRLKKGLFPKMPQSFADGLLRAAATACGSQDTRTESTPATGSEPKKRRFPVGKVLAGAAAAVLVAASVVIAVFVPGIARNPHGATEPIVNPLLGKWALTEVEQNGETVDPTEIGLQMKLEFSDDVVTVTTVTGGAEGQYVYRYTLEDNAITVTAEDAAVTVLPASGTYDPETDTLRFVGADGDGALVFTREPDLVGKWTLTGIGELDPATLGYQYAEWMEFFADGTVTVIRELNNDIEEKTYRYAVTEKNTITMDADGPEGMRLLIGTLTYDPETDTLHNDEMSRIFETVYGTPADLIFSRTPDAQIPEKPAHKTSVGAWSHTVGVDYEQRITIRADGTATLKQTAGALGIFDIQLIYTEKNGELQFVSAYTGRNDSFTAVYDAERDVLTVTMNGETAEYERCIPDLANSFWTMTEMIWDDGRHASAEEAGVESTLTFQDGTMTELRTVNANGLTSRTEYRYLTEADSVLLRVNGMDVNDPEITYDPETDTLRLFTSDDGRTCVYIRTPDLVGKWTVTGVELNGSPDTSGLWMHEEFLEFSGKNSVTWTEYDAAVGNYRSEQYRYSVSGNAVALRKDDATAHTTLTYDPATDTLRLDADVSYSNPAAPHDVVTSIFSRTPDAVIPETERKEINELRTQYPEYFGLDTSKGLKVYVWQMAENDFSCALISGTDERSELEIGIQCKGTTIEQMLLILSTYAVSSEQIEIVPFENPISSYWYKIDAAYTQRLIWLLNGTPDPAPYLTELPESGETVYEIDDPEHILNVLTDAEVFDVDIDGQLESCRLSFGPTSGLFTVVFHVYRNGTLVYLNTFNMAYGELYFNRSSDGLVLERFSPGHDNVPFDAAIYRITIENGMIVLTNEKTDETVEYWGLADPHWNMKGGA